jgi:hypothetical protein
MEVGDEPPPLTRLKPASPVDRQQPRKNPKAGGRFAMLNAFVDFTMATLRRNELAIWLVLFRDSRDGIARTSQTDIARRIGASDRTVRRIVQKLERYGLLKVIYRGGLSRGPSSYRVGPLQADVQGRTPACPATVGQNGAHAADT